MRNLFKSFLFRLRRDLTFRITLFIGLGLAIVLTLIMFFIDLGVQFLSDDTTAHYLCTGQNMLVLSISPAQNFGLAIPINLISFTVLEFTQGIIRNKIITGNSKGKIYFGLLFSGLVFTIVLILAYVGLCVGLGSIFGGFDPHGIVVGTVNGTVSPEFIWKIIVLTIIAYVLIATATIFFATLLRNIGPCIPIVIILLMMLYVSAYIIGMISNTYLMGEVSDVIKKLNTVTMYLNPLYSLYSFTNAEIDGVNTLAISNTAFFAQIINNVVYIAAFTVGGWLIFRKRDVK